MSDRRLLVAGLMLLTVGLVGMSLHGPTSGWWGTHPGSMMSWWESTGAQPELEPPDPAAPTIEVEATEFAFSPDRIVIEPDKTTNLTLVNQGSLAHDLSIPELGLQLVAQPGQTTTAALPAVERSEYRMLCTVPGHARAGMVGSIVVQTP